MIGSLIWPGRYMFTPWNRKVWDRLSTSLSQSVAVLPSSLKKLQRKQQALQDTWVCSIYTWIWAEIKTSSIQSKSLGRITRSEQHKFSILRSRIWAMCVQKQLIYLQGWLACDMKKWCKLELRCGYPSEWMNRSKSLLESVNLTHSAKFKKGFRELQSGAGF